MNALALRQQPASFPVVHWAKDVGVEDQQPVHWSLITTSFLLSQSSLLSTNFCNGVGHLMNSRTLHRLSSFVRLIGSQRHFHCPIAVHPAYARRTVVTNSRHKFFQHRLIGVRTPVAPGRAAQSVAVDGQVLLECI